jgi:hypothetical protein
MMDLEQASPTPPQPEPVALLQQRVSYLERQLRMLLVDLGHRRIADVCLDSRCLAGNWADGGQVPHAAEQPNCCPILPCPAGEQREAGA